MHILNYFFQREKDEAIVELDTVKDRLEMAQSAHNRAAEEKDMTNKELERLLEKYDRYVNENTQNTHSTCMR